MNIENIQEGQIFKNYKAICESLGVNTKTGKSKQLQLKDWERYFKYSKDGYNFIINEIYDAPSEKEDLRSRGNNSLEHADKMDDTLLYILSKQDDGELFLTINRLLLEMKMINSNFSFGNRHKKKVSNYLNIEESIIEEFFNTSKRTLKSNIESMLDRLESKSLIYWQKVKTVCIAKSIVSENELGNITVDTDITYDEFDNEHIKLSTTTREILKYRMATDREIELILEVEDEVMQQLNCKNKQELVVKNKWDLFMKETNQILRKKANILFRYDSYKIIRNKNKISKEVEKVDNITSEDIIKSLSMLNLNNDVQNQLLANWKRRNEKANLEISLGLNTKNNVLRSDESFVDKGSILINNFINIKQPNFIDELKYVKANA
ncbi:hypothetical protein [Metabacillus sp. Hm71]|uniref:hypothetical protein n=1 Tax=Metabacillus sp. Hm71 TaxID=3450743 RepID=UPI003F441E56